VGTLFDGVWSPSVAFAKFVVPEFVWDELKFSDPKSNNNLVKLPDNDIGSPAFWSSGRLQDTLKKEIPITIFASITLLGYYHIILMSFLISIEINFFASINKKIF